MTWKARPGVRGKDFFRSSKKIIQVTGFWLQLLRLEYGLRLLGDAVKYNEYLS
jgi:hypothetical protein